jgi:iron complex transport system ATP-binding protein
MTALRLEGVTVELDGTPVLRDVSASVESGEWVALIGPNGAGKTTLLRAILGLVRARGSILAGGVELGGLSRRDLGRRIALVPQVPSLPPHMKVAEYVLLGRTPHLGYYGSETARDRDAVAAALTRLDLGSFADRRLATLSGGERQRAVIARALAQEAPVLLLDEPTASLDVGRGQQALELVDELRRGRGLTVLSAMHDLTLAAQYAERLLLLDGGRLVASGTAAEVLLPELIARHYGARVRVIDDGVFAVVPSRLSGT